MAIHFISSFSALKLRFALCTVLCCGLFSSPGLFAQWTQATPGNGYFFITNVGSNKVLDVAGSSTKVSTNVVLWGKHGGKNQQFRFVAQGGGYYAIETALKQKTYLSAHNSGTADNTNLKLNNPVGNNQHFRMEKNASGAYRFVSRLGSNLYLGANDSGNNLVLRRGDKGSKTSFRLTASGSAVASPSPSTAPLPKLTNNLRHRLHFFTEADGWTAAKYLRTFGDLNGDGFTDLVGFGNKDIFVAFNNSNMNFTRTTLKGLDGEFTLSKGWKPDVHHRQVIDYNGDGKADIIGFGYFGLTVAINQGNWQFSVKRASDKFSNKNGWTGEKHVRLLADMNGDNILDIIGFGYSSTIVSFGDRNGNYGSKETYYDNFSYEQGWRTNVHERTVTDINNDGKLDLVGFGDKGVLVAYGNGAGGFGKQTLVLNDFGTTQGYRASLHKRTTGDVNGDGKTDLIAFAGNATKIAFGLGGGRFGQVINGPKVFSAADNWTSEKDHRMVADMNKDGRADLVGFNWNGAAILLSKSAGTQASFANYFPKERLHPSSWMADIKDEVNLKDLTIPGTHDSGADYGCPDAAFDPYGECQDWTIKEQLNNGIRYLDIRLNYEEDDKVFRIHHGPCYQRMTFKDVMTDVKAFLSAHPQETIIMRYKDEYDDTEKSTFSAAWNARKTTYSSTFYQGTNWPTLGQARGKVVLLDFCGKASGGVPYHTNYLVTPRGDWHHTGNNHNERLKDNWRQMADCFNEGNTQRSKLYLSAFNQNGLSSDWFKVTNTAVNSTLTEMLGAFGIDTNIRPATPRDIAKQMNPALETQLAGLEDRKGAFGVVALDFPSKKLVRQLLKFNEHPVLLK